MIFKKKKKRQAGPTRTCQFVDNIHWWFWDGANYPGLLTRDKFYELRASALEPEEMGTLSALLMKDSILSNAPPPKEETRQFNKLLAKVSSFLLDAEETGGDRINDWIQIEWQTPNLDVLKAYINVLDFWGYGYSWKEIRDVRASPALLIYYNSKPATCILEHEIKYIRGFPFRFTVEMSGSHWNFDENRTKISITTRSLDSNLTEERAAVMKSFVGL